MTSYCCQKGKPVSHSHQLLNHIVDCLATRKPQTLYAEYPISPISYEHGFMKITYGRLANAVNRIAWWLVDNLGVAKNHETLAYIGPNDLRYPAFILGAVKAGYKTLLLSPRNSIAAQLHLLQVTSCKVFVVPEPCTPQILALLESLDKSYRTLKIPSVQELLKPRCKPFIYDVSFDDGRHAPLTVMHTSGSTGLPKPITWPQDFVSASAKQFQLDPPAGYESTDHLYKGNRVFVAFPPFHAAYVAHVIINAITNQTAMILPLSGAIPSAHSLSETVKLTKVDAALVVPLMMEEMSRSPELLEYIAERVDTMVYCGGDVPQGCGDVVAKRIPVVNFYGSTEGASIALIHSEGELSREEWKFLSFHPDAGTEFRHHTEDMYELFIVRHPELEAHQQIFKTFHDLSEFRTRDLFRRHPTKENLWKHCGRTDDTIVFITGEKVNPINIEQHILSRNPEISGVLLAGSQRFQSALLVELFMSEANTKQGKADLINRFWPSIEEVNLSCPTHARTAKTHIAFIDPSRPMSRSPKGTIQRAATIAEYASDLDALYRAADDVTSSEKQMMSVDVHDTGSALQCLRTLFSNIAGQTLTDEDNFFVQGVDSLQALLLVREIRQLFSMPQVEINTLYAHPTMLSLVDALQQNTANESATPPSVTKISNVNSIGPMIKYFSELIDSIPGRPRARQNQRTAEIYLLTGSTGSLGSYILDSLLKSNPVHVYCLNRSPDGGAFQRKKNALQGLSVEFSDRITFLTANPSDPSLGLDSRTYNRLLSSVTHIIHNAWTVNFNIPLSSYRPQLQGIVNLIKFAAAASQSPSLFYISSVTSVSYIGADHIPESIVDDNSAAAPMGYGASKYVAESLLNHAARRLSLNTQVARVGQIAGPRMGSGQWNRSEWLPSLIRSSFEVCAVPESLGTALDEVNWIPIDELASVLLELAKHPSGQPFQLSNSSSHAAGDGAMVFNVLNPRPVPWQKLLPAITASLSSLATQRQKTVIQKVPFDEWIKVIRENFETQSRAAGKSEADLEEILEANPAVKLIGFYEETHKHPTHTWDIQKATEISATLSSLDEIGDECVRKWIESWFL